MRICFALIMASLLASPSTVLSQAKSEPTKTEPASAVEGNGSSTPKEEFEKCLEEFDAMRENFGAKMQEIQEEFGDDQEAISKAMMKAQTEMISGITQKVLKVAEKAKEDSETSFEAIEWVFGFAQDTETVNSAGALLVAHHLENEAVPEALSKLRMPSKAAHDLFEQVIAKSENKSTRGLVSIALIEFISKAKEMLPMFEGNPSFEETFPDVLKYARSQSDVTEEELLERYKKVVEEYGDVETDDGTIGDAVAKKIKRIETRNNVAIGKVAPDIEGPDIDGVNFKLSDYRGKVVMLDFWGDW